MAWDDDMPLILRTLIDDNGDTPVYSDDRLATQVVVTAPLLLMRVSFANAYQVSVQNLTITPDPTKVTPRDDAFISLTCLLAAQNLVTAEVRNLTRQGIDIQDGDSRIKLSRDPQSLRLMTSSIARMFDDAMYAYKTGGSAGFGQIITGPYKLLHGFGADCGWGSPRDGHGWGYGGLI